MSTVPKVRAWSNTVRKINLDVRDIDLYVMRDRPEILAATVLLGWAALESLTGRWEVDVVAPSSLVVWATTTTAVGVLLLESVGSRARRSTGDVDFRVAGHLDDLQVRELVERLSSHEYRQLVDMRTRALARLLERGGVVEQSLLTGVEQAPLGLSLTVGPRKERRRWRWYLRRR